MPQNLKDLLIRASKGKATLFCGAGASLDSINFQIKELPAANPLLQEFNDFLQKDIKNLSIAASMTADQSIDDYYRIITEKFTVLTVSDDMLDIAKYPWRRIYTTNYDDSIEKAFIKVGKNFKTLTAIDQPSDIDENRTPIIHLHGFVNSFRKDTIRKQCILDYTSNVANEVYTGPWSTELKNDIATSDVVIFLGYSLYDPEVSKLILQGNISKAKIYFINSRFPNAELEYMQSTFGTACRIEKDGLAELIREVPSTSANIHTRYICFRSSKDLTPDHRNVNYQDVNDLFLFGKVKDSLLQADIISNQSKYIVQPQIIQSIKSAINSGNSLIALYAPLGHGKTMLSKILAVELGKSYDVFFSIRNQESFISEIKSIISNNDQPIIIIDDYYKYIRYQTELSKFKSSDAIFIFTSRLGVYETRKEELPTVFLNHQCIDIRVGQLNQNDAEQLVPLINQAGLWGELSKLPDGQKASALLKKGKDGYQANFADILIGLMSSSDMISRIQKELEILKSLSTDAYQVVLLSIYLEFTNNHIDEFVIDQALGVDLSEIKSSTPINNIFRIFFSPEPTSGSYFSGSLFAKYAMEKICDASDLLGTIETAANRYAKIKRISQEAKLILIDLLRFNYLKSIAGNDKVKLRRIRDLYSNLSANPNLNRDDLFWNAFGMCERQLENYEEAIRHFRTGISYSKVRNERYISYHAQNQLIICLLERGIAHSISTDEATKYLSEVADLLLIQADDERTHGRGQAFKWHQELLEFLEKYYDQLSSNDRTKVFSKLAKYLSFIKKSVVNWQKREQAAFMVGKIESFLTPRSPKE